MWVLEEAGCLIFLWTKGLMSAQNSKWNSWSTDIVELCLKDRPDIPTDLIEDWYINRECQFIIFGMTSWLELC